MSDSSWPPDLRLDLAKSNWEEWSFLLKIKTNRLDFSRWLKGTLPQPDATTHAKAHEIWETNDCSLRGFIFEHISKADYNAVSHLATSHLIFNELCQRHEKLRPQAQLILLKKALDFCYDPNLPFCDGADEIIAMHTQFVNIGPIDLDHIKIILLLNAFSDRWEHLQSSLWSSLNSPNFGVNSILRRLQQEDARARSCAAQSGDTATALAAIRKDKPPRICSNCQKEGHVANFCIKPGGGMAGKTLDEAHTAQRNARRSGRNGNNTSQQTSSAAANVATTGTAPAERTVTIDGQTFTLTPTVPTPTVAASVNTAMALSDAVFPSNLSDYDTDASSFAPLVNFALASTSPTPPSLSVRDNFKFKAYTAFTRPSHTSVDWRVNSADNSSATGSVGPVAYTAN
jgi:hypothetical protein